MSHKLNTVKTCSKCGETKPITNFSKNSNRCRDCVREYHRAYNAKSISKEKKREHRSKTESKKQVREYRHTFNENVDGRSYNLFYAALNRSKLKNLEFDITKDWVLDRLRIGYCEETRINFDLSPPNNSHFNPFAPSIDRINSSRGYTKDNCRVIIAALNIAFGQWGEDVYEEIAIARLRARGYLIYPSDALKIPSLLMEK